MEAGNQNNTTNIPFRIKLGVTGHRQLPDRAILAERIQEILSTRIENLFDENSKKLIESCKNTKLRFTILTPLAEGADRLVAQEVLRTEDARIEVVLPLALKDYLEDFETEESRNEFKSLLDRARRITHLKTCILSSEFPQEELEDARRDAYRRVGEYVVDHCDVLIALWDGKEARGRGGTAEIIAYAKMRNRPVIIIYTVESYAIEVIAGHGLNAQSIEGIERYNTYSVPENFESTYVDNMYRVLFNNLEGSNLSQATKTLIREQILPYYVKASTLSKENQEKYLQAGFSVYALSAAAVACIALGIFLQWFLKISFVLEFFFLLAIYIIIGYTHKNRRHERWIENRFLVESIRSAIFMAVCNTEALAINVPPFMGLAHRVDDWMIRVFEEIWGRLPQMKECRYEEMIIAKDYIRKYWIKDQIDYHTKKSADTGRYSALLEMWGKRAFVIALGAVFLHIILSLLIPAIFGEDYLLTGIEGFFIFIAIALPAIGASIGGIRTHREYSRISKRSYNMVENLTDLDERFALVTRPREFREILRQVEELMLRETQDWLMLMRFLVLQPV